MISSKLLSAIALVSLVIQNSSLILILRHSRTIPGPRYYTTTAVLLSELIKLTISFFILLQTQRCSKSEIFTLLFGPESLWVKLTYPAILYTVQNNLQYVAATLLDAATFQVTYQMKILTTAVFSVIMLGKVLSAWKWISLIILTAGIALVQLPDSTPDKEEHDSKGGTGSQFLGLMVVGIACCLSGLAGVYFEKILKKSPPRTPYSSLTSNSPPPKPSLWVRNTQLSLFSSIIALILGVIILDGRSISEHGFFYGYTPWTWAAITCQAVGGLIVAVVVKYADNILKGFATSVSIILSSVASVWLFDFQISWTFAGGAGMVILATYMYGMQDAPSLSTKGEGTKNGLITVSQKDDQELRSMTPPIVIRRDSVELGHGNGEGRQRQGHEYAPSPPPGRSATAVSLAAGYRQEP